MTPDEKRAQFATRDARPYAIASASWALQLDAAPTTELEVRICCHSGITRPVADLVAEDYSTAGWTVAFVAERSAGQADAPHEGSVLVYSIAPG